MTLALQILLDLVAGLAAPFQRGHRIADRALLHNLFQQVGNLRIMFFNRFASASSSTNSVPVPAQGSTAVKFLDPLEQRRILVDTTHARSMSQGVRIVNFILRQSQMSDSIWNIINPYIYRVI